MVYCLIVWLFRCWCICVPRHDGCWILFARKTSRKSVHMVIKRSHVRNLIGFSYFFQIMCSKDIRGWVLINTLDHPQLNLDWCLIHAWSKLINTSIDTWLMQNRHLCLNTPCCFILPKTEISNWRVSRLEHSQTPTSTFYRLRGLDCRGHFVVFFGKAHHH